MKRYIRSNYTLNGVLKDVDEVVEEVDALIRKYDPSRAATARRNSANAVLIEYDADSVDVQKLIEDVLQETTDYIIQHKNKATQIIIPIYRA